MNVLSEGLILVHLQHSLFAHRPTLKSVILSKSSEQQLNLAPLKASNTSGTQESHAVLPPDPSPGLQISHSAVRGEAISTCCGIISSITFVLCVCDKPRCNYFINIQCLGQEGENIEYQTIISFWLHPSDLQRDFWKEAECLGNLQNAFGKQEKRKRGLAGSERSGSSAPTRSGRCSPRCADPQAPFSGERRIGCQLPLRTRQKIDGSLYVIKAFLTLWGNLKAHGNRDEHVELKIRTKE